jgi:hypothetical protein
MTAISAFFRKTPVLRLKEYFTSGGFTSLAPVDWIKPEADVVKPLIKAVDGMTDDERQRVVLDAGRVAALCRARMSWMARLPGFSSFPAMRIIQTKT